MIVMFVAEPGLGPGLIETALRLHGELGGTTETPGVCDCLADYKNPAR
jgi:hypothetical protein